MRVTEYSLGAHLQMISADSVQDMLLTATEMSRYTPASSLTSLSNSTSHTSPQKASPSV